MTLGGVSHLAFGVRDMDRSLAFYRDALGMEVISDRTQKLEASDMYADPEAVSTRRVVQLRWTDSGGIDAPFLVLSAFPGTTGKPLRLDQVGIHHIALWVHDLAGKAAALEAAGAKFVMKPTAVDARGYGGAKGSQVLTCLFEDPDGIIVQFDERLP